MLALVVHVMDCLEEKKIMQKLQVILHLSLVPNSYSYLEILS